MMILGRLAVDANEQGSGLGKFLLRDALLRFSRASQEIGLAGLLVHAISEDAKRFYLKYGFVEADRGSMQLIARYKDLIV